IRLDCWRCNQNREDDLHLQRQDRDQGRLHLRRQGMRPRGRVDLRTQGRAQVLEDVSRGQSLRPGRRLHRHLPAMNAAELVRRLDLIPHPEGGYFRETYRASEGLIATALPRRFGGARSISTAIYFLLEAEQCSHLHRIRSDEVWHFYAGDPLEVVEID